MSKKKKINKIKICALCKKVNSELKDSHIIPKLVLQQAPNSRFRNVYQTKDISQDGEKKPMLCHKCEQFFNRFETLYTNKILDPHLKGEETKELSQDILDNFINSMSWRIIYDDLYNHKSFVNVSHRSIFEGIEQDLREHLNRVKNGKTDSGNIKHFTNYIFNIDDFNYKLPVEELFTSMVFGHCRVNKYGNYFIIAYFLGLVFVTEYKPSLYIGNSIINHFKRSHIKARIKEELLQYADSTAQQLIRNEKILDEGLRQQIEKQHSKTK